MGRVVCGLPSAGFDAATGRYEVIGDGVGARIVEPTSKVDALRVLDLGDRRSVGGLPHRQAALAELRQTRSPAITFGYMGGSCLVGAGQPGGSSPTVGVLTDASGLPLSVVYRAIADNSSLPS
ncbi:hypothetical protein [Mycobacterium camsae]|uniref:hypothetical protein n=1 Tax=Mycobacterium gordonae TaxID=1778 RepID=UPI00197F50B0